MKQSSRVVLVFATGFFLLSAMAQAKVPVLRKPDLRSKIGSVFSAPVSVGGKLYFVSTSGVLIESDSELKVVKPLFEGKRPSLGGLALSEGRLIWGDGLHSDQNSTLFVFDLKTKKIIKSLAVKGHIERVPLILADRIVVPLGFGGIAAYDSKSFSELWRVEKHANQQLHVDSNPVPYGSEICVTTLYQLKGILCFDQKTGKETRFSELKRDPKSEIVISGDLLVGFSTEGNLLEPKFDVPSDFFVYDLKSSKMKFIKELRGFNLFAPSVQGTEAFITLSTGDFILMDLETQKITFLGEYPEPFINSAFRMGDQYCGVGIGGKFSCYLKTKGGAPALSKDSRLMETVIGKVSQIGAKVYLPTRIGYSIQ